MIKNRRADLLRSGKTHEDIKKLAIFSHFVCNYSEIQKRKDTKNVIPMVISMVISRATQKPPDKKKYHVEVFGYGY